MKLHILLQYCVPHHLFSRLVGVLAGTRFRPVSQAFIRIIRRAYDVDLTDAERTDVRDYETFNDFFTRSLRADARPISGAITSPCDGTVSQAGALAMDHLIQAKGLTYSVDHLLGEPAPTEFEDGSFITIYLAPRDYHRVHVPIPGKLLRARYIPGRLFSVNEGTANNIPDLFVRNERLVTWFDTTIGPVAVVMVGAMIVAGIKTVWRDDKYPPGALTQEVFDTPNSFEKGDELGHFEMGSTVIVVLPGHQPFRQKAGDPVLMGQPLVD